MKKTKGKMKAIAVCEDCKTEWYKKNRKALLDVLNKYPNHSWETQIDAVGDLLIMLFKAGMSNKVTQRHAAEVIDCVAQNTILEEFTPKDLTKIFKEQTCDL